MPFYNSEKDEDHYFICRFLTEIRFDDFYLKINNKEIDFSEIKFIEVGVLYNNYIRWCRSSRWKKYIDVISRDTFVNKFKYFPYIVNFDGKGQECPGHCYDIRNFVKIVDKLEY